MANPGLLQLADDFGDGESEGAVDTAAIDARLDAIRANVAYVQSIRPTASKTKAQILAALDVIYNDNLGPFDDLAREAKELLHAPKVDVPPVAPPTTSGLYGVAVSYPSHGMARDLYLGYTDDQVQWGAHSNLPITAPVAGTVTLYSMATPLAVVQAMGAEYHAQHVALFSEWVCSLPLADLVALGQNMYIAVLVYDTPLSTPYGVVRADWAGHVKGNVKGGRVAQGEQYAESFDSGIRFELAGVSNARAAHIHACASATGTLTPNGDLDGLAFAAVRGWAPITYLGEVGPGPTQYQQGGWTAGRRTADFTLAGKPLPPLPQ
jgi:hypothetical protein